MTAQATIDIATDEGGDVTGKTDSLFAWQRAAAALKKNPGTKLACASAGHMVVSDGIVIDGGGSDVELDVNDLDVLMQPGRQMPAKNAAYDQQGRHLFQVVNAAKLIMRGKMALDYQGALQPQCIGDIIRTTNVGFVDIDDLELRNPRGLTTSSTPTLPETFAMQLLHPGGGLIRRVRVLPTDGAPTATGIVAHFQSGIVRFDQCFVENIHGQGFGTYEGVAPMVVTRSWAHLTHHSYNVEGGQHGTAGMIVGDPHDATQHCASSYSPGSAIVVNGNPGKVATAQFHKFASTHDARVAQLVGTAAGHVALDVVLVDPQNAIVQLLGDHGWLAATTLVGTIHESGPSRGLPLLLPKTQHAPASWALRKV